MDMLRLFLFHTLPHIFTTVLCVDIALKDSEYSVSIFT